METARDMRARIVGKADADVTVRIGTTPLRLPNPVAKRRVKHFAWEAAPDALLAKVDDQARYLTRRSRVRTSCPAR